MNQFRPRANVVRHTDMHGHIAMACRKRGEVTANRTRLPERGGGLMTLPKTFCLEAKEIKMNVRFFSLPKQSVFDLQELEDEESF